MLLLRSLALSLCSSMTCLWLRLGKFALSFLGSPLATFNVLELASYGALVRDLARSAPDSRFVALLDSQVAKAAAAKGRSTSKALAPGLRRLAAHQLAYGLYPALGFAPTRLNVADDPTRFVDVREPCKHALHQLLPLDCLHGLGERRLSRPVSGWARLFLLLCLTDGIPELVLDAIAGRFRSCSSPYVPNCHRDFDSTLGFPGKGPLPEPLCDSSLAALSCRSPWFWARAFLFSAVCAWICNLPFDFLSPGLLPCRAFDSTLGFPGEGGFGSLL